MNHFENWFWLISTNCDAAESWQVSPQDPATPIMEWMVEFHNFIMCDLCLTGGLVAFFLYLIVTKFNSDVNKVSNRSFSHDSQLEIAWTLFPTVILILIAFPSFTLLYAIDELIDPAVTLKVVGHQWYWSYEYGGSMFQSNNYEDSLASLEKEFQFDSYMIPTNELKIGRFRLLEVDNRVKLPIKTHIRLLITSSDVLHSWAVPSFGVKLDACPGRLSQTSLFIKRSGVFYGQCSEICGINHGFMPIVIEGISAPRFIGWILKQKFDVYNGISSAVSSTEVKEAIADSVKEKSLSNSEIVSV